MARKPRSTSGSLPLGELLESKESRAMASFDVRSLDEMLRFPPRRYVTPAPLRSLRDVQDGEEVSAIVTVESLHDRSMRSRRGHLLEVRVSDGSDTLELVFFLKHPGQAAWHRSRLPEGATILVRGTAHRDERRARFQIAHPEYETVEDTPEARARALRPRPVYPLKKNIAQNTMRTATALGLEHAHLLQRPVPPAVLAAHGLPELADAVRLVHDPADADDARRGRDALAFEEAFVLQAIFAQRRALDERTPAPALRAAAPLQREFDARLPFTLTAGQVEVGEQIAARIAREHPTSVLLQGDVGSGKTVVALRAMLRAVDSGYQAALLAPTEVLAEQHHRSITSLLGDLAGAGRLDGHADATRVRLLTGSQRTADRRETLLDVTSGAAGIVIGTHALLTESVEFAALGLVVIDEQHRFGVDHRRRLRSKGADGRSPHVVVMTATPIPRTAALATVGDLDVLSLRESPGHRRGMTSFAVHEAHPAWERRMWERAGEEIRAGRQVFVVCPRIDEDEEVPEGEEPARGVLATAERLARRPELGGARIGVLHGRMTPEEKQDAMARVLDGDVDVLVATTVIEVGVDVPNASVMIVLDAERFGVSQLHQLRGRVGRGEHPGIAFLDTRAVPGSEASRRLETIAGATDGFELAEKDLAHRGAGDLVGEEQSGLQRTLRHLDLRRDAALIEQARDDAFALLHEDPDLADHPALEAAIADRLRFADPDVERS